MDSEDVLTKLREFVAIREWNQFHTPENLAKSVSIEAGELLELFQWGQPKSAEDVKLELADVLTYCYLLADQLGAKPEDLILEKMALTGEKYPIDKARGSSAKYDQL